MATECKSNKISPNSEHYQPLLQCYLRGLRKLYDHVQGHIRGLCSLGVNAVTYSTMMCDIILAALPHDVVVDYNRQVCRSKGTAPRGNYEDDGEIETTAQADTTGVDDKLTKVLEFLLTEVESRERSATSDRVPKKALPVREMPKDAYHCGSPH